MTLPLARSEQAHRTFLLLFAGVFGLIWAIMNVLLHFLVLSPIKTMARQAEAISKGAMDTPEFESRGRDEIASLARSFNLMYRSLGSAMKMIGTTTSRRR